MIKEEIISKVKSLNLPKDSYVVYGSCPMAIFGLREAHDIDLLVSEEVFEFLRKSGWKEFFKSSKDRPLTNDAFEAHDNWDFSSYSPSLKHLLEKALMVDGIPFASLEEVRKWKLASARPKDLEDVKLIDIYTAVKPL